SIGQGAALIQIVDALVDVCIDRVIWLRQIAGVEHRLPPVFSVIVTDRSGEDRKQVFDAELRRLHQLRIVERGMEKAGMDEAPAVKESIGMVAFNVKPLIGVVLKDRNGVIPAFNEQINRLRTQLRRKEAIKEDRAPAALRVTDLSDKDRLGGGVAA